MNTGIFKEVSALWNQREGISDAQRRVMKCIFWLVHIYSCMLRGAENDIDNLYTVLKHLETIDKEKEKSIDQVAAISYKLTNSR